MNGITTRQYLEGDKIIAEEVLNASGSVAHTKYYIYDQTGIAGMVYDGDSYYFGKNIFGDVTTIYDSYGNWEASYEYDLWGNITSGGSSGIAKENPFRFRGYYYDSETGFYYLQSRYYDPEICRFINADNLELLSTLSGTPGQLNLYAYCNNNPVMYSDPSGEGIASVLIILGISILFNAIDGGITALMNGQNFGLGLLAGAISGVVAGFITYFIPHSALLARGASSAVFNILNEVFQTGGFDPKNLGIYAVDVALDVMLSASIYTRYKKTTIASTVYRNVGDIFVDIIENHLFFSPEAQSRLQMSYSGNSEQDTKTSHRGIIWDRFICLIRN